jgi:hypothetical protein
MSRRNVLAVRAGLLGELVAAARDKSPIVGLTHNFYRYPARFSPKLVRAVIQAFSAPTDLVLDPFMGGGTTLVEAIALGRHAFGTDISSLATFISEVKTTLYSDAELQHVVKWAASATSRLNIHAASPTFGDHGESGYRRNLNGVATWRLRKAIAQALTTVSELRSTKLQKLARCVVLRTAQWALDGRRNIPSIEKFRRTLIEDAARMTHGARELRQTIQFDDPGARAVVTCVHRSTNGLEDEPLLRTAKKPKLVITSPPYPGIHVLYHRWQVDGRRETPAPFWIADRRDGSGSSYYTMGDIKAYELNSYFENLRSSLRSIAAVCSRATTIVQVVAFSNPEWHLPRYLSTADDAGMAEVLLPNIPRSKDGRLWRSVPNRKWHANQKGKTSGSQEVVLFHRLK